MCHHRRMHRLHETIILYIIYDAEIRTLRNITYKPMRIGELLPIVEELFLYNMMR